MITSTLEPTRKAHSETVPTLAPDLKVWSLYLGTGADPEYQTWIPRTRSVLALVLIKNY